MSDDIDIEEHDVLDNPRIKNIFPDITSIKTEVIEYEEIYENGSLFPESMESLRYPVDDENPHPGDEELPSHHQIDTLMVIQTDEALNYPQIESGNGLQNYDNRNYSESDIPNTSQSEDTPNLHSEPQNNTDSQIIECQNDLQNYLHDDLRETPMELDNDENLMPYRNMIVLGSKPCPSSFNEPLAKESDSDSEPEIHPSSVVLVDYGVILKKNPCFCAECKILFPTQNTSDSHKMAAHSFLVAVSKNTAMKSTTKSIVNYHNSYVDRKLLCTHCNKYFPSEDDLLKHTYELIPNKFTPENPKKCGPDLYYVCPICAIFFKTLKRYRYHLNLSHNLLDAPAKGPFPFNPKCIYCGVETSNKHSHTKHVARSHKNMYFKKAVKDKFECQECNLTFPSAYSEKIHRAAKHHAMEHNTDSNPLSRPVPKSTLFKCNKCQIHFVYCLAAMEHAKQCKLTKGDWKCPKCRRCFKAIDRVVHTQQHELTDRIKVYVVNKNMLKKVLCRCLNCNVTFDEYTFIEAHGSGCIKTLSTECNVCHMYVHDKILTKHIAMHNSVNTNEFIIREFVCSKMKIDTKISKLTNTVNTKKNKVADKINTKLLKLTFKLEVAYCSFCKCCMKKSTSKYDFHVEGNCKDIETRICKLCGLTFTKMGIVSHKADHDKNHLKLSDIKFFNIQKNKVVNPPIPEFKFCARCKVHFFSFVALTKHTCDSDEHKTCGYCNKKFSDLAFKLHVPFHEYIAASKPHKPKGDAQKAKIFNARSSKISSQPTIPELLKKYQSLQKIWNILYICSNCDIAFDDYDTVVEHCQDHFNNLQSYNQTVVFCDICDLKMISNCFNKHNKLHANSVHKSAFKILKFKYDHLLNDDWLNIFEPLAEDQVNQILSKSIYKVTRNIRMELSVDGPIDLTLYQCKVCNKIVEPSHVLEHANRLECPQSFVSYYCSVCHIDFSTETLLQEHEDLHKTRKVTKDSFRIISFRNKKDFFNNTLLKHMKTEDLKFIRCQHCGKLINKSQYKAHISKHASMKNLKLNKPKVVDTKSHVLELYMCRNCEVCVLKPNLQRHRNCYDVPFKKLCKKCNLWFHTTAFRKHEVRHEKYKNIILDVYYMKDCVIERDEDGQRIKVETAVKPIKKDKEIIPVELTSILKKGGKLTFYQCSKCYSTLMYTRNVARHSCPKFALEKCSFCGLHFFPSRMLEHNKLHTIMKITKKDIQIIKFNSDFKTKSRPMIPRLKLNQFKNKLKPRMKASKTVPTDTESDASSLSLKSKYKYHLKLYKCFKCLVFFVSKKTFLSHTKECNGMVQSEKCPSCGVILKKGYVETHIKTSKCNERDLIRIYATVDIRNDNIDDENNWLFSCFECQTYFFSYKNYTYHLDCGHKSRNPVQPCDLCNITFASGLDNHLRVHHSMSKPIRHLNIETLHCTEPTMPGEIPHTVRGNKVDDVKSTVSPKELRRSYGNKDTGLTDELIETIKQRLLVEPPRRYLVDRRFLPDDDEDTIYRCHICDLHFINPRTIEMHVIQGLHYNSRASCPECNRSFTFMMLKKHRERHKKYKDFKVLTLDEILEMQKKIKNESIVYGLANNSLENKTNEREESKIDVTESDNQTQDTRHSNDVEIATGSNENKTNVLQNQHVRNEPTINNIEENNPPNIRTENRLYKCSECDVYYLTAESCSDHCYNHSTLDPTEYIACKICDLQFLCESLGKHMKTHREKTFSIDDLIITEYRLSGSDIKNVTYSAVDALKLKQVTTTTHSDIE